MRFKKEVFEKALKKWGEVYQSIKVIEELSELQKEVCSMFTKNTFIKSDMISEIADVYIMIEQLKIMMCISDADIQPYIDSKTARLEKLIKR